jgi:hypothetical protein
VQGREEGGDEGDGAGDAEDWRLAMVREGRLHVS